jgi:putative flavoprotein involved in K+ transport
VKPVVIVGAGPAGLATAAALAHRRIGFVVCDDCGEPGGAYRTMYERTMLVSPSEMNELPGLAHGLRGAYMAAGELHDYLRRYAAHHAIAIDRAKVGNITRELAVTTDRGTIGARAVVVASGMWRFPAMPEGLPAHAVHSSAYRGPTSDRTLVIGRGASAIEIAEEIARIGAKVWLSARAPLRFVPAHVLGLDVHRFVAPIERALPTWLARRHCAGDVRLPPTDRGFARLRDAGQIEVCPRVARFDGATAHFVDGTAREFGHVIAATGFGFRTPFLPDEVSRAPGGQLSARRGRSHSWPHLHVVGHPCAVDLGSQFLRGIARDSALVAEDIART